APNRCHRRTGRRNAHITCPSGASSPWTARATARRWPDTSCPDGTSRTGTRWDGPRGTPRSWGCCPHGAAGTSPADCWRTPCERTRPTACSTPAWMWTLTTRRERSDCSSTSATSACAVRSSTHWRSDESAAEVGAEGRGFRRGGAEEDRPLAPGLTKAQPRSGPRDEVSAEAELRKTDPWHRG